MNQSGKRRKQKNKDKINLSLIDERYMMVDIERRKALLWRSVASVVLLFGLMIFMVCWVLLASPDMSNAVNAAVTLIAVLIAVGALVSIWITWSISFPAPMQPGYYRSNRKIRAITAGVCLTIWAVFGIMWIIFFSGDYSIFQNTGILLAATVVIMGIGWVASEIGRH